MKKAITVIIFASVVQLLSAQGWISYVVDSTDLTQNVRLFDVVQTPDKGFLSVGWVPIVNGTALSRLIFIKTDEKGKTQNMRTIQIGTLKGTLLLAPDGNYYLYYQSDYLQDVPIGLLKISPNGDSLSNKILFRSSNIASIQKMLTTRDSQYLTFVDSNRVLSFRKYDREGNLVWRRTINESFSGNLDFVEEGNGNIFYVSNGNNSESYGRLSSDGSILTPQTTIRNVTSSPINNLIQLPDGNFRYIRQTRTAQVINGNGQTLSSFVNNRLPPLFISSFKRNGAEFYLGTNDTLYKMTPFLGIEWAKRLDFNYNRRSQRTEYAKLASTNDGGFVICGRDSSLRASNWQGFIARLDSFATLYSNRISGRAATDLDLDCQLQATDVGIRNFIIKAENLATNNIFYAVTDSLGRYVMPVDTGIYRLSLSVPSNDWLNCRADTLAAFPNYYTQKVYDFPLQITRFCPKSDISISTPLLRRCFDNTYIITYCNKGTIPIQNGYIDITLDTALIFQSSTLPVLSRTLNKVRLGIGNLDIFECKTAELIAKVSCDTPSVLGRTLCVEARMFPDTICTAWQNANIVASGACNTDSVRLNLQNIGRAATSTPVNFVVIEDEIILIRSQVNLNPNSTRTFSLPKNGRTYRIIASQEPNAPFSPMPTAVVEGCGRNQNGGISTGFVNVFDNNDSDAFLDVDCQVVRGSYDPNDKQGVPMGYGRERFIEQNQDIEYKIRFQNTGTDTAFTVVLRDTISPHLIIESVEFGTSSHPYQAEIVDKNVLKFTFNNILLPDSFVNVAKSVGFVQFRIKQKRDVALGTKIYNSAGIYFDFNEPIITNQTVHTIGKNFVLISAVVDKPLIDNVLIKVYPNPFSESATFEIENRQNTEGGNFELYNAVGQLVRREKVNSNHFEFYRNGLNTGVYFFRITEGGKILGSGKLMVQ